MNSCLCALVSWISCGIQSLGTRTRGHHREERSRRQSYEISGHHEVGGVLVSPMSNSLLHGGVLRPRSSGSALALQRLRERKQQRLQAEIEALQVRPVSAPRMRPAVPHRKFLNGKKLADELIKRHVRVGDLLELDTHFSEGLWVFAADP